MRISEQVWIHRQLEPTDILITGKQKREPVKVTQVLKPAPPKLTEDQENKIQDEFLKRYGI